MKLRKRSEADKREYLINEMLRRLDAMSQQKRVRKLDVKALHAFFSTQFEALKRVEFEAGLEK